MKRVVSADDIGTLHSELVSVGHAATPLELKAVRQFVKLTNAYWRESQSVQYTIVYAMAQVAQMNLGGTLNARLTSAVGRLVSNRLGYDLALETDDPLFRELYKEFVDVGPRFPPWVAGRMVPHPGTSRSMQLALPGIRDPSAGHGMEFSRTLKLEQASPKVYIASALTHLSHDELARIEAQSAAVARVFSNEGFLVHQPVIHTHPARSQDLRAAEIHSIDYGCVADSDVLVFLNEFPSTGAGKELAWADIFQLAVVIVSPMKIATSRLVTGATGNVQGPIEFERHEDLEADLADIARKARPHAHSHRDRRIGREALYRRDWLDLRQRILSTHASYFEGRQRVVSAERVREIISSPTHYCGATVQELHEIELCLSHDSASALDLSNSNRRSILSMEELEWLHAAQIQNNWSYEEVYELLRLAEEELVSSSQSRRLRFNTVPSWEQFKRAKGG